MTLSYLLSFKNDDVYGKLGLDKRTYLKNHAGILLPIIIRNNPSLVSHIQIPKDSDLERQIMVSEKSNIYKTNMLLSRFNGGINRRINPLSLTQVNSDTTLALLECGLLCFPYQVDPNYIRDEKPHLTTIDHMRYRGAL